MYGLFGPSTDVKADGVMRQFLLQNTGLLPIKLMIFDCDDVMRVSEMVAPSSQYPFEQHTCVPLNFLLLCSLIDASSLADTCRCPPSREFASCCKVAWAFFICRSIPHALVCARRLM